jgi:PBP1b-binding outer membrane lipoprotein LpoB
MKSVACLLALASALLLSGCIIVIEQPKDAKDAKSAPAAATSTDKK